LTREVGLQAIGLLVLVTLLLSGCAPEAEKPAQEPTNTQAEVPSASQASQPSSTNQSSPTQFPPSQFLNDLGLPLSTNYELDWVLRLPTGQVLVRTAPLKVFFVGKADGTDFRPVCGSAMDCEYVGLEDDRLIFLSRGADGGRWHFPEEVSYHLVSGEFECRTIFLDIFEPSEFGFSSMEGEPIAELKGLTASENGLHMVTKDIREVLAADTIYPWTKVRYRIADHTLQVTLFRTRLATDFTQAISGPLVKSVGVTPHLDQSSVDLVFHLKNTVVKYNVQTSPGDGMRFVVYEFSFKEEE